MQNQPQKAVKLYKAALEVYPHSPDCNLKIAENLQKLGRLDDALKYYRKAVALSPKCDRARKALAAALKQVKK